MAKIIPIKSGKSARGFVLLYALLVSSIVLTIGLSLSDIFYKQLLLSSVGQSSQVAYYAADSFRECLHFANSIPNVFGDTEGTFDDSKVLICTDPATSNSHTVAISGDASYDEVELGPIDYTYKYSDSGKEITVNACAKATITDTDDNQGYIFKISGFNVSCDQIGNIGPRVVQRVITMQS